MNNGSRIQHEKYKYMKHIGFSPVLQQKPLNEVPNQVVSDPYFDAFLFSNPEFTKLKEWAQHRPCLGMKSTFLKSLLKCDKPKIRPSRSDNFYNLAMEYTYRMYQFLEDSSVTPNVKYNQSTTPGLPYTKLGFSSKHALVTSEIFEQELQRQHTPVWQVLMKAEYLPEEEILDNKGRTYFCSETPFVFHQKYLFDHQDELLKSHAHDYKTCWSRYGFIRQYGGIHDLVSSMNEEGFDFSFTRDVSGWDRVLPIMDDVYELRGRWLGITDKSEEFQKFFNWVTKNTIHTYIVGPDGHIYERDIGNLSGSGKTTSDNTIAHTIIDFYFFIKLYYHTYNNVPTYEQIVSKVRENLYGDDQFGRIKLSDWFAGTVDEFFNFMREVFLEFGLVIKDSACGYSNDSLGLEFLGTTINYNNDMRMYYGSPRYSKVLTSLTQILEEKTIEGYCGVVKALSVLIEGCTDEKGILIRKMLPKYAKFLIQQHPHFHTLPDTLQQELREISHGKFHNMLLVYGLESGLPQGFNFFYPSVNQSRRVGGGFKRMEYTKSIYNEKINYSSQWNEYSQSRTIQLVKASCIKSGPDHTPLFTMTHDYEFKGQRDQFIVTASSKKLCQNKISFECLRYYDPTFSQFPSSSDDDSEPITLPKSESKYDGMVFLRSLSSDDNESDFPVGGFVPQKNFEIFVSLMKSYYQADSFTRTYHPLHEFMKGTNDKLDAARLAMALKEGSFNPYGNGQFSPTLSLIVDPFFSSLSYIPIFFEGSFNPYGNGQSYCLVSPPICYNASGGILCTAYGYTPSFRTYADYNTTLAIVLLNIYSAMMSDIVIYYELITPINENPLFENEETNYYDREEQLMTGSFNPYGNGQPKLSKAQYLKVNKVNFDKLKYTAQQREAAYNRYSKRTNKTQRRPVKKQIVASIGPTSAMDSEQIGSYTRVNKTMGNRTRSVHVLSDCARKYIAALHMPFMYLDGQSSIGAKTLDVDLNSYGPCIPTFPALKTRRAKIFSRGPLGVQANGFGCIFLNPRRLGNNYDFNSYQAPILYSSTTSTFADAQVPTILDTTSPWIGSAASYNSDYDVSELTPDVKGQGIKYRVVGAGLRIRYVGPELTRAGLVHCFEDPGHSSPSGYSLQQLGNYESYFNMTVKREWIYLSYTPVSDEEFTFNFDPPLGSETLATDNHYIGMLIEGAPPGATFQYESVCLLEVIGQNVRDLVQAEADSTGLSAAVNTISPSRQSQLNLKGATDFLTNVVSGAKMVSGLMVDPTVKGFANQVGRMLVSK